MSRGTLTTALAGLVLISSATALASSPGPHRRPPFARAYVGTVTGTLRTHGQIDTWTVRNLTFRLRNARYARGRWGGTYLVKGGRVTFTTNATGGCNGTKSGSFALGALSWDSASISFLQNLGPPGGYGYQARVSKQHPVNVAKLCSGAPNQELVSPAGGQWLNTNIGQRLVPGKRLVGRYVIREDEGTRTWTWSLAPR